MHTNILLNTDSYKTSQYKQYPLNTTSIFSYIESRGGYYDQTVFFGLQMFLKEYLTKPITQEMINEADEIITAHMGEGIFNRSGWEYILNKYSGYLPLIIKAVPEGTIVPTKNVLVTVENTDPACFWLTSYIETALLRGVWYPTTVATISWNCKQIIKLWMEKTCDNLDGLPFKLHDFGARGVSSLESAGIGGCAHLVNFMGTDTISSLLYAKKYYSENMAGFSIPASEHSTITSWGQENEVEAYRNMLRQFAKPESLVAIVSDSYDIYNAMENLWGSELKQEVIDSGATIIIRPDSGNPPEVVCNLLEIAAEKFGYTINTKGYKVLNHIRIIQGDGINFDSIQEILSAVDNLGFSIDNIAFGMGGALLQHCDRDTQQWAMKCSAAKVNGKWIDVFKDPITDPGKISKKGRLSLYHDFVKNEYSTEQENYGLHSDKNDVLEIVFNNGDLIKEYTFEEIRERASR